MQQAKPPEGFTPLPLNGTFNDALHPVYIKVSDDSAPEVGLLLQKQHLNSMGICHGAVTMALFDIAFACAIGFEAKNYQTPTINISIDYLSASKEGEWLWVEAECLKTTKTTGFASGLIRSEAGVKARGSGVFKIPAPKT
ncbi:PaaI family thioesterase [Litorivivens sp.]|uniref:PaaI family thioesterase n=1 Tax=Litorivivens sp. TaxID=2020868 RepID=UPI00356A2384